MDYFPHDTDAVNDEKIEILRMMYGNDGYAFYFILLERIYRTPKFELDLSDEESKAILTRKVGVTPETFDQMLNTAIKYGCFDREIYQKFNVLTSNGIKKRASVVVTKRDYMRAAYNKKISASETSPETPQRKEKKSKEKKSIVFNKYSDHEELNTAILEFIEFRTKIKKLMTERGINLMLSELNKLSTDPLEQIAILNQSIARGWTGIYPVKSDLGHAAAAPRKNSFHNFEQTSDATNIDQILRQKGRAK